MYQRQPEAAAQPGERARTVTPPEPDPREHAAPDRAPLGRSNRPLRVALFTNSVAIGGMEKHVAMIARDLDREAATVYTICPQWAEIDPWAEELASYAEASARITPDRRYGARRLLGETYRLWRQLRQWRIDVLHMHLTSYYGGNWALTAARLAGVRAVFCTEHLAPEQPVGRRQRFVRDLFTRNLDGVISVSELNRAARARHLLTPPDRTTVVNNGIDLTGFTPIPEADVAELRARLGIPEGAPVVGTVVRFVKEKGLPYLLDAMPRVLARAPETRLLMVGDGPLRDELEQRATRLGYGDRIIFAGFQADPRPYLALMNAFVLPVPFGSASIGLLEAMAMGCAVIITFGGEGEAVVRGVTGLYSPPRDPEALADTILRVIQDPALERTLGENARHRIEEHFSSRGVAAQLLALYQSKARR